MAGLTKPPGFGTNSWDETTWAAAMAAALPRFRVADDAAWKPSVTSADRTVAIAAGGAWGCGVWDRTDATETKPFAANTSGADRYDLLVARYNWATDTRTFEIVTGTTVPPLVNATSIVDSAKVNRIPGTRYEGIIAVLRVRPGVGAFASTDLFDVRPTGRAGALQIPAATYVNLIDGQIGDELNVAGARTRYRHDGTAWAMTATDGAFSGGTGATGNVDIAHGMGVAPGKVWIQLKKSAGPVGIMNHWIEAVNAGAFQVIFTNSNTGAAISGNPVDFDWFARR